MSIGKQLRQAREAKEISLEQVAQATHIRLHYLEALEADRFDQLPSSAQLRGFLRSYSEYLKIDSSVLIQSLDGDLTAPPAVENPPPAPVEGSSLQASSDVIFKEIGQTLQSQRELMGLSLSDVERHTHIRMHYVRALEDGDIAHLPSPVQGRGMLSNYASFLGLSTEAVLLRFADGLQAGLYNRQATREPERRKSTQDETKGIPARPSQLRRLFSMDLFVSGFLIIFLLGFAIWGALRISSLRSNQVVSPTAPPVSEILLTTPGEVLTATLTTLPTTMLTPVGTGIVEISPVESTDQVDVTGTPAVLESTPALVNAPVQIYVIARQRAWVRVTVDGEIAFEGRLIPGSAYSYAGNERIVLLTGDGGSLQVYYNQQDLGVLGSFGEVVEQVFSIEGAQTATPAVPPTRTPAPTSTPGATSTPTRTPMPSSPTPTPRS